MEPQVREQVEVVLRALGEVRQAKGDGPLARFLRRIARGDARRLRAFHDLSGGALEDALRDAVSRLPEEELARLAKGLTEQPEEAIGALSGSAAVRHTLLTRACGRLLDAKPLDPGERIDARYEVAELVGVGGMGVVYRAIDTETSEEVAVKVLRAELGRDAACVRRFMESSRLVRSLDHPGVVRVIDVSAAGAVPYLTMEWVGGPTLRMLLDERGRLSAEEAEPIVVGVLQALSHAHEKGILHLDLKPENVLLPQPGEPKLCDFDLARVAERTGGLSLLPGAGTPDYMAPEQRREGNVDRRSDVYAAGVMIYEMLSGRLPGRYTPMLHTGYSVPVGVSRAVEAALHDDPGRRPADASVFLAAIGANPPEGFTSLESHPSFDTVLDKLGGEAAAVLQFTTEALVHIGVNAQGCTEYRNVKDGSILIYMRPMGFLMGAGDERDENGPVHWVNLSGHLVGKYPVTNAQYRAFCKETGHPAPRPPDQGWGYPNQFEDAEYDEHPVVGVTWHDAFAYCEWAGLRLPSEAQWEQAARSHPYKGWYPWGESDPSLECATFGGTPGRGQYTRSVKACPAGASPCGAMDLAGNVWEWCQDWYDLSYYSRCARGAKDPAGATSGARKVVRGGGWSNGAGHLAVYVRDWEPPDRAWDDVGFRVARGLG